MVGAGVPEHLAADAEVPILTGPQAQGDLMIVPLSGLGDTAWRPVTNAGIQLVQGEATGNTHWLHPGFGADRVSWAVVSDDQQWGHPIDPDTVLRLVRVPDGQSALLIHTDEHGANGIGPGTYAICRKREHDPYGIRYVED